MISKNGSAIAVLIVSLGALFNFDVNIETATQVVGAIFTLGSFIVLIYNQLKRWDTTAFFFKK